MIMHAIANTSLDMRAVVIHRFSHFMSRANNSVYFIARQLSCSLYMNTPRQPVESQHFDKEKQGDLEDGCDMGDYSEFLEIKLAPLP